MIIGIGHADWHHLDSSTAPTFFHLEFCDWNYLLLLRHYEDIKNIPLEFIRT